LLTIVGVAPEHFRDLFFGAHQDVWVPIPMFGKVMHVTQLPIWRDATEGRDQPWLTLIGRLKNGITLKQARARVDVLAENLRKTHPADCCRLVHKDDSSVSGIESGLRPRGSFAQV
jgi:hypothetical protein